MTALKPLETHNVVGIFANRYPPNRICAHPECGEAAQDNHHIFPRSFIGNGCWFVEIDGDADPPIPHVSGLCRAHHESVERHDAWIKMEGREFVWYDREGKAPPGASLSGVNGRADWSTPADADWQCLGPLDPQPGGREKAHKPKRRNYEKDSQERRQRKRISVAVPNDTEDGGAIWDETLRDVKAALVGLGLYDNPEKIPNYEAIIAALRDWLNDLVPVYPLPDADRDGYA